MMKKINLTLCVCLLGLVLIGMTFAGCSKEKVQESPQGPWEIVCYFYMDDANAPVKYTTQNNKIKIGSVPTKTGYVFNGLFDSKQGGTMYVDELGICQLEMTGDMTLYAQWKAIPHYIVFEAPGATLNTGEDELEVAYGSTLQTFPIPVKQGFTFVGWEDSDGVRYSNGGAVLREKQNFTDRIYQIVENTVRLYARFETKQLTVTFDFNDSRYLKKELSLVYGQSIPEDQFPDLDTGSSIIIGWSAVPGSSEPYRGSVTEDLTLYPIWKDYRVITLNDTFGNQVQVQVYRNEPIDLKTFDLLDRPGYRAEGWYTSSSYSGLPITELTYTLSSSILYAKWEPATYTLQFDAESAGSVFDPITYHIGDSNALPVISRNGYVFNGWCTKKDLTDAPMKSIPTTLYGDYTLYASFSLEQYTIRLYALGGVVSKNEIPITYQGSYQLEVPTRVGYRFLGWFNGESDGATRFTDDKGTPSATYGLLEDLNLYAHWESIKFTVRFDTQGGSSIPPQTVEYNSVLSLPADPTYPGKIFGGWYNEDFTVGYSESYRVLSDITLYAKWITSTPISNAEQLKGIAADPTANYHLTADINLGGAEWQPIAEFSGILNGKGYKISNFTITSTDAIVGFIGTNKGTIKDLTLKDFTLSVTGDAFEAGAVCAINEGTVQDCSVLDAMLVFFATVVDNDEDFACVGGGVVGTNSGTVDGCYAEAEISARSEKDVTYRYGSTGGDLTLFVGMIAGYSEQLVQNSTANGRIEISLSCDAQYHSDTVYSMVVAGGAVGYNEAVLSNCYTDIEIEVVRSYVESGTQGWSAVALGGLVGLNDGTVTACGADGSITDSTGTISCIQIGGFAYNNRNVINNCYSNVSINVLSQGKSSANSYIGGFVSLNSKNITNSYCTGAIATCTRVGTGGFVGENGETGMISKCFTASDVTATTSATSVFIGRFVGAVVDGGTLHKVYYKKDAQFMLNEAPATPTNTVGTQETAENLMNENTIYNTLSWNNTVWITIQDGYPALSWMAS